MNSSVEHPTNSIRFSHVQLYVDKKIERLSYYKEIEEKLNEFDAACSAGALPERKQHWRRIAGDNFRNKEFVPQDRDVVVQLLVGFGFRIVAQYDQGPTRSFLITSRDPKGVKIIVTASRSSPALTTDSSTTEVPLYLQESRIRTFLEAHGGRPGIGVLAFVVENLDLVSENYRNMHPDLILSSSHGMLEVYAYYNKQKEGEHRTPDKGTVLLFMNEEHSDLMPGFEPVHAKFDSSSQPAYCDHWVSNVFSRTEFLETLDDVLGFKPKVDFNAGVVAAGEAQIESTVTGNLSSLISTSQEEILKDQSQVFLPINNALSTAGHVHGFLEELGQGIQHVASRVSDLVGFIQRCNEYREITNEGFSFLHIPRSYYGVLTVDDLAKHLTKKEAEAAFLKLLVSNILSSDHSVKLDTSFEEVEKLLHYLGPSKSTSLANVVLASRYKNLSVLLGTQLSEQKYLAIVQNQILVDVQGQDLLFQIFTSNILQHKPDDEAPFFEFIQRVCSECYDEDGSPKKIKPGCGGFGIRNFLTLFLSIEVSKAMQEAQSARENNDTLRLEYAEKKVDIFTRQLNESNPILTEISDAMTLEGYCRDQMSSCGDKAMRASWEDRMLEAARRKNQGNEQLLKCSDRFNRLMRQAREQYNEDAK